jgi:hypothetical protein
MQRIARGYMGERYRHDDDQAGKVSCHCESQRHNPWSSYGLDLLVIVPTASGPRSRATFSEGLGIFAISKMQSG